MIKDFYDIKPGDKAYNYDNKYVGIVIGKGDVHQLRQYDYNGDWDEKEEDWPELLDRDAIAIKTNRKDTPTIVANYGDDSTAEMYCEGEPLPDSEKTCHFDVGEDFESDEPAKDDDYSDNDETFEDVYASAKDDTEYVDELPFSDVKEGMEAYKGGKRIGTVVKKSRSFEELLEVSSYSKEDKELFRKFSDNLIASFGRGVAIKQDKDDKTVIYPYGQDYLGVYCKD